VEARHRGTDDDVRVEGEISLTANAGQDEKANLAVHFTFNSPGAKAFGEMTERNKPTANASRALAILNRPCMAQETRHEWPPVGETELATTPVAPAASASPRASYGKGGGAP